MFFNRSKSKKNSLSANQASPHKEPQLANRTFLLLIVTGLLPSLIAALVMVQTQQALLSKRSHSLQQSAENLAEAFSRRLRAATAELNTLAGDHTLANPDIAATDKLSRLHQIAEDSKTFDEFFLLNSKGELLTATSPTPLPFTVPQEWLGPARINRPSVYGPLVIEDNGPKGLMFCSIIQDQTGKTSMVLVGFSDLRAMAADMESFVYGQSGLAVLTAGDGSILAGSVPSLVGRRLEPGTSISSASSKGPDQIAKLLNRDDQYYTVGQALTFPGFTSNGSWKVLVAQSRNELLQSTSQSATWSLITVVVITPVVLILGLFFGRSMSRGLGTLITATKNIAAGDLRPIPYSNSYREIAELADTFNHMTASLAKSREEVKKYQGHLEQLVEQRTRQLQEKTEQLAASNEQLQDQAVRLEKARQEAVKANEDLKVAQAGIIQMEKMSSLGQLVAGIAHEINTPIGAVFNCVDQIHRRLTEIPGYLQVVRSISDEQLSDFRHLFGRTLESPTALGILLPPAQREQLLRKVLEMGLTDNARQLAEIIGRLGLTQDDDLQAAARLARQHDLLDLLKTFGDLCQCSKITKKSAEKIANIVQALRYYSHADKDTLGPIDLRESLSNTLVIMQNKTKSLAEVKLNLPDDLPSIYGNGSLSQVWTNLINNAIDAIEEKGRDFDQGRLEITAQSVDAKHVAVTVGGNGKPISPEARSKIFDPFFTTKPIGRGCGLGLSIVTSIVNHHGGKVEFDTTDDWTSFTITLPIEVVNEPNRVADQVLCNMR